MAEGARGDVVLTIAPRKAAAAADADDDDDAARPPEPPLPTVCTLREVVHEWRLVSGFLAL